MNRSLHNMTLEELWELFPIQLVEHKQEWGNWALEEINFLHDILGAYQPIINHIGSTAISGIKAKEIIDILVELSLANHKAEIIKLMEGYGYILMKESDQRLSFNKGYTIHGYAKKVYHIHFHERGDNKELLFRDYLIQHKDMAKEYESLKLKLLNVHKNDRDAYTNAKTGFINMVLKLATSRNICD